eukprot:m.452128 g.452128  ORF g.452128 m.452128 type:complete len:57 (+) comp20271_c0_seq1:52-222(+)
MRHIRKLLLPSAISNTPVRMPYIFASNMCTVFVQLFEGGARCRTSCTSCENQNTDS